MIVAVIISVLAVAILSALFLWFRRSSPKQQRVPDAPIVVVKPEIAKKIELVEQPQVLEEDRNPWNRWKA